MARPIRTMVALLALVTACAEDGVGPGPTAGATDGTDDTDDTDGCTIDCETREELIEMDCTELAVGREKSCYGQYFLIVGCCADWFGDVEGLQSCQGYLDADEPAREYALACWRSETGPPKEITDEDRAACPSSDDVCPL